MLLDLFRGKGGGQVLGRGQKGGSGRRRKGGKGNVAHIS